MFDLGDDPMAVARNKFASRPRDDALGCEHSPSGVEPLLSERHHLHEGASSKGRHNVKAELLSDILDIVSF